MILGRDIFSVMFDILLIERAIAEPRARYAFLHIRILPEVVGVAHIGDIPSSLCHKALDFGPYICCRNVLGRSKF